MKFTKEEKEGILIALLHMEDFLIENITKLKESEKESHVSHRYEIEIKEDLYTKYHKLFLKVDKELKEAK